MFVRSVSALAIAVVADPAHAADDMGPAVAVAADVAALDADQGSIIVTGQRPEYGVLATRTATKTDTDVKDIP